MASKSKMAFGTLEKVDIAISEGKVDSFDILFVKDANGKPYVGWVDRDGQKIICDNETDLSSVEAELATKANASDVESLGSQIATKADASAVAELEAEIANKADVATVQTMIEEHSIAAIEVVEF